MRSWRWCASGLCWVYLSPILICAPPGIQFLEASPTDYRQGRWNRVSVICAATVPTRGFCCFSFLLFSQPAGLFWGAYAGKEGDRRTHAAADLNRVVHSQWSLILGGGVSWHWFTWRLTRTALHFQPRGAADTSTPEALLAEGGSLLRGFRAHLYVWICK